jgi:hypothetical protein
MQIAQRAQALAFLEAKVLLKNITEITKLNRHTIFRIQKRTVERGYHPETNPFFQVAFFKDQPRSGRHTLMGPRELRTLDIYRLNWL